jgi:lipoprotein-anchoring transpeptidase ErfK/SrfK
MTTRRNVLLALAGLATTASAEAAVSKTPVADKKPAKAKKSAAKAKTKPKAPAKKRLIISINKVSQKMTVSLDGDTKFVWPVSTGAKGYDTPSGNYRPFRMEKEHFSKEWDDAPMPYSIFFTAQGHAVHGSYHIKSLGRRASHGCVRLAPDNAAKLFALVGQTGMSSTAVVIKGGFFDGGFRDDLGTIRKRKSIFPWENRT